MERTAGERDVLGRLLWSLNVRRALLYPPNGRPFIDGPHIRESVEAIRADLVKARQQLKAGHDAAEWVEAMARACNAYLDAVERVADETEWKHNFEPAMTELREFIRSAATHFRRMYGLAEARTLVRAMYEEDIARANWALSYEDELDENQEGFGEPVKQSS